MFKIYDTNHTFVKMIDICKSMRITADLQKGTKNLYFQFPLTDEYLNIIAEEYYIETADDEFVVKEINMDKNDFFEIYCNSNLEELRYSLIPIFDAFEINVESCIKKALQESNCGWTLQYNSSIQNMVTYQFPKTTPYEIIQQIKRDLNLDIIYDTKNKQVKVYTKVGKNLGIFFSNELKLKMLKRQGQAYDFATVLYPIGKDGLTIGKINNDKIYLENFSYCNKYLPKYWIQEDIDKAEQLKMAGEAYLSYISSPIVGYSLELNALPDNVEIGDSIVLIDKIKKIKQKQRIVKIVRYPFSPEKDRVELSNRIVNFADSLTKYNTDMENQIAYIKKNLGTLK